MGTVEDHLYCFVCVVLCLCHHVKGEYAYVTVDPSLADQRYCSLLSNIKFSLETGGETLTLDLVRNDHVHPNVPTYIIRLGDEGEYEFIKEEQAEKKHLAAYQDPAHESALFVKCNDNPMTGAQFQMEGTIFVKNIKYRLLPSDSPVPFYRRLFHDGNEKLYHLLRAKEAIPFDSGIEESEREYILSNSIEEVQLPERPARVKRDAVVTTGPQVINIDVLVLLEYSVIEVWKTRKGSEDEITKAKEYFAQVLNGVSLRYQRIEHEEYKYNIRLIGFYIAETANASSWSEDNKAQSDGVFRTNATQVLSDLKQWVYRNRDSLVTHDHLMLFTSYDLVATDNGFRFNYTTGFAYFRSMCDTMGNSVSVVEDHGGFQSVGTAAHELGHSLGAKHDGGDNACHAADRYIMAPRSFNETDSNKFNPWFFSTCSVDYFVNFTKEAMADTTKQACLTESLSPNAVPNVTSQMPGQLYLPDNQCQHLYGDKSYLCRGVGFDVGNILCRAMFCYQPIIQDTGIGICRSLTAARGTTCGNKKWCVEGACVESKDAPVADDSCPHGDQPYVITNQGDRTCQSEITRSPGLCYDENWSSTCCITCKQACDGPTDCRCRDRQDKCIEAECERYDAAARNACCWTCRNYVPPTTTPPTTTTSTTTSTTTITTTTTTATNTATCTDLTEFEGVTCSKYVQNMGRHVCYSSNFSKSCCNTCKTKIDNTIANCEWGDRLPTSCYSLYSFGKGNICPTGILTDKCCETCAKLFNALNSPRTTTSRTTNQATPYYTTTSTVAYIGVVLYFLSI